MPANGRWDLTWRLKSEFEIAEDHLTPKTSSFIACEIYYNKIFFLVESGNTIEFKNPTL